MADAAFMHVGLDDIDPEEDGPSDGIAPIEVDAASPDDNNTASGNDALDDPNLLPVRMHARLFSRWLRGDIPSYVSITTR